MLIRLYLVIDLISLTLFYEVMVEIKEENEYVDGRGT